MSAMIDLVGQLTQKQLPFISGARNDHRTRGTDDGAGKRPVGTQVSQELDAKLALAKLRRRFSV